MCVLLLLLRFDSSELVDGDKSDSAEKGGKILGVSVSDVVSCYSSTG